MNRAGGYPAVRSASNVSGVEPMELQIGMNSSSPLPFVSETPEDIASIPFLTVVDGYIRYYAAGNGHTARAKRLDLHKFLDFLTSFRAYSSPEKLTVRDWDYSAVQRFVDELLIKGEAPATVARRLATIKHMGRTLAEKVSGFVNPAREIKSPQHQLAVPQALSSPEVSSIRQKAKERTSERTSFNRLRNQVLFNFLLDTGLRADEVRLLKVSQLDEDLNWIRNVRTKGRRYRNVYITSSVRSEIKEYLQVRKDKLEKLYGKLSSSVERSMPLFISVYKAHPDNAESFLMGTKSVWRAINELSARTKLHPHLLRHSYALELLDSSKDVRLVSQALGHSDVRITMRYTERRDAEIAQALEKSRKEGKGLKSPADDSPGLTTDLTDEEGNQQ